MFGRLLILFITIPVLELFLFLYLGARIGIAPTFAIIVATAFLGAYLTKSQGLKALRKYQEAISQGRLPHEAVLDGLMILVAGAVLLTPGFLTDAVGFALLLPSVRARLRGFATQALKERVTVVGGTMGAPTEKRAQGVITVEAEVVEESPDSSRSEES
ncbi:MAG: FxsA family protein [Verrucomicrobiales bacterium]